MPAPARGGAAASSLWEGGVGLLAAALGVVVIIDAAGIRAPAGVQVVGPRVFPVAVGCLLLALGLGLALQGLRHRFQHRPHHAAPALAEALLPDVIHEITADAASGDRPDLPPDASPGVPEGSRSAWRRALMLLAALVAYAVLLRPVGFVLASTALFTVAVTAFGGRPVRGLLVGAVLSVVVYIAFTQGLELRLPGLPGIG
ncbi:MAG: tripartite tricarboxylate transporter TctB family protein [Actinomycetota bacterium]|nr:tripartite tricarboxylate transporter TctB family protein [Actinomycetota bacterium]